MRLSTQGAKGLARKIYLTKTPNKTYRVRFKDEADKWWSKTFKTKTDAEIFQRAVKRDESIEAWFPEAHDLKYEGTFKDLANLWLDHAENVREISQSCLGNYKTHLKHHICPVLGSIEVDKITLADIERLASVLKKKKPQKVSYTAIRKNLSEQFFDEDEFLSTAYRREILTVACMIAKWATERNLLNRNPFEKFVLPEKTEQPYDFWRLDEEDAFLSWLEAGAHYSKPVRAPFSGKVFQKPFKLRNAKELYDIVLFALRSGLRLGEIAALTNHDVNLREGWVRVRASYNRKENKRKNTTKNKKYRYIEMNDDMREILERRKHVPDRVPIFKTNMNSIKFFSRTCRWAGVKEIHFHCLRHTCLTNLANGYGMDAPLPITQVQQIAGHSDIKTTMRYVHTHGIKNTSSGQWSREQRKKDARLSYELDQR